MSQDDVDKAVSLFVHKEASVSRAAELAGISLGQFVAELRKRGIPWVDHNEEGQTDDTTLYEIMNNNSDKPILPSERAVELINEIPEERMEWDYRLKAQWILGLREDILQLATRHGANNVRYYIREANDDAEIWFVVNFEHPNLLRRIGLQQALGDLLHEPVYVFTEVCLKDDIRNDVLEQCHQI